MPIDPKGRSHRRVHPECRRIALAASLSEKNARRRAVEVGGDLTRADITWMRREASECAICGCALTASGRALPTSAQLDHVVPLAIGGAHSRENVRIVCRSCNLSRPKDGSDLPFELVERMTELQRRLFREAKERSAAGAARLAVVESEAARRRALACSRRGYASARALRASVQPARRDPEREALLDRVSELRARGLGYKAIGRELGLSRDRARDAVRTVERRARVA